MSATHAQVWDAYQRVWGRLEGRGYTVSYTGTGPYGGCVWWDRRLVEVKRVPAPSSCSPEPADEATVREELCILCHELAHVEGKDDDETNWIYYYGVLNQWAEGAPPGEGRAKVILAEEERAEREGRIILQRVLFDRELLEHYESRAAENLAVYRKKLGLPEKG